jgi:hypothetical protein
VQQGGSNWIWRLLGGGLLGGIAYAPASLVWGLSTGLSASIGVTVGLLFLILGGQLIRWLTELLYWS